MKFRIDKITIENYKGIERLELDNLSRVNILIGANNTKKTTVLEGIYIGASYFNEFSGIYAANTRDLMVSPDKLGTMFNNLDTNKQIKIKTLLNGEDEYEVIYSNYRDIPVQNNTYFKSEVEYTVKKNNETAYSTVVGVAVDGNVGNLYNKFYTNLLKGEKKIPESEISYVSSRSKWESAIIEKFNKIKIENKKRKLVDMLSQLDENIVDLEDIAGTIYVGIKGLSKMLPLKLMGDGIYNLFDIGLTIAFGNKIILIDEIENGMHYYALQEFLKEILRKAVDEDYQLFITTHSMDTLKAIEDILKFNDNDLDISFINLKNKEGNLETKVYKKDEFLEEMYQGWDIR